MNGKWYFTENPGCPPLSPRGPLCIHFLKHDCAAPALAGASFSHLPKLHASQSSPDPQVVTGASLGFYGARESSLQSWPQCPPLDIVFCPADSAAQSWNLKLAVLTLWSQPSGVLAQNRCSVSSLGEESFLANELYYQSSILIYHWKCLLLFLNIYLE